MNEVMRLSQDVDKAMGEGNPDRKRAVLARVDGLLLKCKQFADLGDATFMQIGSGMFARVNMSKRQEMASSMVPMLEEMRRQLST